MSLRPSAVQFALALAAVLGLAGAGGQRLSGPHDGPPGNPDRADFWMARNRESLARHRHAYPVGDSLAHRRGKFKFKNGKRISSDLLGAPPASLPTAQAETQTEPYVAVDPNDPDRMIAGWQESRFSDGGARSLGVALSTNGGRKWRDMLLPGLTLADGGTWNRASDPWPAFGPNGEAYFASLLTDGLIPGDNAIGVSVSPDGGKTWLPPVEVVRDAVDFNDKVSMVVDTRAASPDRGNAYVGWDVNAFSKNEGNQRMVVARSTDGGASWKKPVTLIEDDTNIGIVMQVGPDGTLYAVWAGAGGNDANLGLRFAKSADGGRTFSKVVKIADYLVMGVPGFRAGAILPSFAVDPLTGDLFAVWPDGRFTGVDQAAMSVSRDGGKTWSAPVRVNDGPAAASAMTIGVAVNGAGDLLVGYYTLRDDSGSGTRLAYYVNRSTDGGATFESGIRVTRKPVDTTQAANAGGSPPVVFLGDYVGLAGTDAGFIAVITDVRKASKLGPGKQPDIYGAVAR